MLCKGRTTVFRSLSTITFLFPPFLAFSYSSTFPDMTLTLRSVVQELLPLLASFQCLLLFELTLYQSNWSHGLLKSYLSFSFVSTKVEDPLLVSCLLHFVETK